MNQLKKIRHAGVVAGLLACVSVGALSVIQISARAETAQETAIDAATSTALTRMSETLKSKEFSFRVRTVRAYVGGNGELLHIAHTTKTVVRRPDRLAAEVVGDDVSSKVFYNGKTLVVYGATQKQYASVPAPGEIGGMLDVAENRMKIDFPLADLLTDNPGKSLLSGVTSGGQVGMATIDGTPCRHFFFIQSPDLDLELWLEDNERALPRRVFVTYRSLPGHPTFLAELSDWDFSIHPSDGDFEFQPPAEVARVELTPQTNSIPAPAR
jgi:hypothetical protein